MTHYIVDGGLFDRVFRAIPADMLLPWRARPFTKAEKAKKASKQRSKYTCRRCELSLWGKPDVNVRCGECDVRMVVVD